MDNKNNLLHPNQVEKAKRRAQSMIFESFTGVNGNEYCNCFDGKLKTNILYVPAIDKDALKNIDDNYYKDITIEVFDSSVMSNFESMHEDHYLKFRHGSLYVPFPYIPSTSLSDGRFGNELYYWDSYLYVLCLLSFDQIEDAKGIVRNFCYQLKHYGMILNGNRTYYLGRSQPPFLSSMVMAIYDYLTQKNNDTAVHWLKETKEYLILEYNVWEKHGFITVEHKGKAYRLARYFDKLSYLCPEALDEDDYPECILGLGYEKIDNSWNQYFRFINNKWYFIKEPITDNVDILNRWKHSEKAITTNRKNSCAERASGIDTSDTAWEHQCAEITPICLNSLLWKLVSDLNKIAIILNDGGDRYYWSEKQDELHHSIQNYLWNDELGVYQNRYIEGNFTKEPFITTIYPMMFGLTSKKNAQRIADYVIKNYQTPYGIRNTKTPSKCQWDHIWGINAYFLNKAFRMYDSIRHDGQYLDTWAGKITIDFINNVVDNFDKYGTFFEKYNGEDGTPHFKHNHYGNQKEFVWTASALLTLLHRL